MGQAEFALEIEINASPSRVFDFLCDLRNYLPLHPLIESIAELETTNEMPGARRYEVVDRIPVGPFSFRTTYTAALEPVGECEVRGHAWQWPGVEICTVYTLESTANGTRLCENAAIKAPGILRRFVAGQACGAHRETLLKMKQLLEDASKPEEGSA